MFPCQAVCPRSARFSRARDVVLLAAALLAVALLAAPRADAQGRQGGRVTMLWAGDVDTLDPGATYINYGSMLAIATQRPLFTYRPEDVSQAVPDLAAGPPVVSADGLSVTVRIRAGVRFSPPVSREVTSADVKYAIERGFYESVASPYAQLYFGDIVGARAGVPAGTPVPGIETPDAATLVFRLSRAAAGTLTSAMVMPLTAPVPREYAARFDAASRSAYARNQVSTGPYMIRNDAQGRLTGYRPGRRIELIRNPNWVAATDFRPARLDAIDIRQGNTNLVRASRRILNGRRLLSGDFPAPLRDLRRDLRRARSQFDFVSAGAVNFIPLNTARRPFKNANVRRAVVAGFDRAAALRIAGGRIAGQIASHFIPPGVPGFDEAGGRAGPGLDFLADRHGDRRLAARYLRRAGFARGRFTGRQRVVVVTANDPIGRAMGRLTRRQLQRLGFRVRVRAVRFNRMLTLCGNPRARVHACPLFGWIRDFPDAQSVLEPLFHGRSIQPRGNTNLSQLNVPAINQAMDAARTLTDPTARAQAWGAIDREITATAPGVPLNWPRWANVRSRDVIAVANESLATWDLSFAALR
jgi:peptide/nickel transport system substrate-binding protein